MLYTIQNGNLMYEDQDNIGQGDSVAIINREEMLQELDQKDEFDQIIAKVLESDALRFESHDRMNIMCLHIHAQLSKEKRSAVHIFMQEHCLWIVSEENEMLDQLMNRFLHFESFHWTLERVLYHVIDDFFDQETHRLDQIQKEILKLEDTVITNHGSDETISEIIHLRKRLLRQERAYEQAEDALDRLLLNENQLIPEKDLNALSLLKGRCHRLSGRVDSLQAYVTEIREAYQAEVDINLNVTMRIFTVITAVFLPLTLIAGWYGMNLKMPEYDMAFGYPMVIGVSILITISLLVYFKRHRWF